MSQKSEFRADHVLTAIVAALLISVTAPALAVDAYWDGSESTSWTDTDNWSNTTTDSNIFIDEGLSNFPVISSADSVLSLTITPTDYSASGASLTVHSDADLDIDTVLDVGNAADGSITMDGGTVDVGTHLFVGNAGVGSITQSSGTVNVSEAFMLGNQTTAAGSSYNISGGALNMADDYHGRAIGVRGAASMNVSGSAVVTIGGVYYSTTGFEIGGHLSGGQPTAGSTGTSTLTQTGGTVNVTSGLPFMRLGIGSGVTGIYDLQGGTLNLATDVENWAVGTGYIKVNGGTLNFTGDSIDVDNFEIGTANGVTGQFTLADYSQSLSATNLTIGSGTGTGTLNMPQGGGTVNVGTTLKVGNTGVGSITMNGGTVNVDATLDVGSAASSVGGITMSGGTINAGTYLIVGNAGVGSVTQTGGTVNVSEAFMLGYQTTAAGSSYNISGGELNMADDYHGRAIGARGAASMNVSGSAVVTIGGVYYSASGFEIGGHLSGGQPLAGSTGTSTLTQTGGIVNVTSGLPCMRLGIGTGVTGIYDLQGGTLNLATDVENWAVGTGYIKVNGGTLNFSGDSIDVDNFEIGTANGSYGHFTLAGSGQSLSSTNLTIGTGTGIGTLNIPQNGGTVNVGTTLKVGNTGVGSITMNGGTINVDATMIVGSAGFGSVTQTGGTVNVTEIFDLGNQTSAAGSSYSISGGELNIANDYHTRSIGSRGAAFMNVSGDAVVTIGGVYYSTTGFEIGGHLSGGNPLAESTGTSVLTQTGGTVNVTSGLPFMRLGIGTGVTGIYDLQGGTLNLATDVENWAVGTGYMKVNGGTLNFTGDSIDVDNFEIGTMNGATGEFTLADSQSFEAGLLTIGSGTGTGTLNILGGTSQVGGLLFGSATSQLCLDDYQTFNILQSNYSFADAVNDIANGYVAPCTAGSAISVETVDIGGTNYTQLSSVPWSMGEPMVFYWGSTSATAAKFEMTEDGGYNIFRTWDSTSVPVSNIAAMESYNLRPILTSESLLLPEAGALDDPVKLAQLNALIDTYKECSNAYAYRVCDEPSANDFEYLARMVAHIRARDPDHLPYINLLAPTASTESLGGVNYATYLQQFIDTVHPVVLSYDYYGLNDSGDAPNHLHNLGVIANAAKDAGIPFINVVQNCKHDTCSWIRKPTASEMRFLTTSTLAYGAAGIGYFNYSTTCYELDEYDEMHALGGVYDNYQDETTDVYDWVTPLNEEFKNVAAQYQGLEWLGTYLRGYSTLPPGTTQLAMTGVPFNVNLSNTETYTSGDPLEGLLFGFFDTDGTGMGDATFVYIANLDYSTGVSYTLTGPGGDLSVFDATNNVWTDMESSQITLNLVAGGGVFVGLTSMVPYIPSPVPEPSLAIGLLCLAFATLAAIRRRRV